ncbi:MAG: glycine--tRNA ligase subunit beta [Armatimonadetes bacterium]|nr:glycine--tRNA ligase subunit beta [Armatimonadota bacterium]
MPDLLFELGCEELPASSVRRAFEQLKGEVCKKLEAAGIGYGEAVALGTPRRLILSVKDVVGQQPDKEKEARGPALAAAYDSSGAPTKALEGFCRGQGIEPGAVEKRGEHVWAVTTVKGVPTIELLGPILTESVLAISFDKTMRWANGSTRFARPIRWIVAKFGDDVVSMTIEGVTAGSLTRGHRFEHPDEFEAGSFESLLEALRTRMVEPDPERRIARIREGVAACSQGKAQQSDELVEENAYLCEWPSALEGTFPEHYLQLPKAVLTTVMAKHERFFPVYEGDGKIVNRFVSVRNGGQEGPVREGNAWVLNARLNDASFFFQDDSKSTMADFLEKTSSMHFQEKLGTVRARADRLEALARETAVWSGASQEEADYAEKAGLFAKADLSTGLVSELDELQGVIGGEYARREGMPDAVCWAIASHYDLAKNLDPACEGARTSVRLLIADQVDKLAGFMGLGLTPSGSSDPYGLRRSATLLIEACWTWPESLPSLEKLFSLAFGLYRDQGAPVDADGAMSNLKDVFRSRYEALLTGSHRYDLVNAACLEEHLLQPRSVRFRLKVLEELAKDVDFVQTATRPANIVSAAKAKGIHFESGDRAALDSAEGSALDQVLDACRLGIESAAASEHCEGLIIALRPLIPPINAFFDSTMVMVDDSRVRDARLSLLSDCAAALRSAGDFTQVVIEG